MTSHHFKKTHKSAIYIISMQEWPTIYLIIHFLAVEIAFVLLNNPDGSLSLFASMLIFCLPQIL